MRSSTPAIFRDANLVMALVMIFMVGLILLAGLALLPPMLQGVMGYPVVTTGMVLAPRGVGTMISMIVVGRLVGKVDARLLILTGLSLTAFSLWQMTQLLDPDGRAADRGVGGGAGAGARAGLRAADDARVRDAGAAVPGGRGGAVQPDPQHRLVGRHLDRVGAAGAQHRASTGRSWWRS